MNIITVFIVLLSFMIIGYSVILFCKFIKEDNLISKLSVGYALGVGLVAFELFIYSRTGIKWGLFSIYLPWAVFTPVALILKRREIIKDMRVDIKLDLFEKTFAALSGFLLLFTAFESVIRPLSAWDGFAIWLVKSKMFFIDGFVNPMVYFVLKDSYPYVVNLSGTFIYEVLGKVDDTSVLLLFYGFYLFLFLIFFSVLREKIGTKKSFLFSFLLISTQNVIRHGGRFEAGYADLTLGFYIFVSYYLLRNYLKHRRLSNLIILQIILGITSLIKVEGLTFCLIVNGVVLHELFIKQKRIKEFFFSLLWMLPALDWQIFKTQNHMNFTLYENPHLNFYRIPAILFEMGREFINIQNWNLLWIIFFITIIYVFIRKQLKSVVLLLITAQIVVYFLVFIISPNEPNIHVRGVFNRLLLHVVPLAVYFIAVSFINPLKKHEE